MYSGWPLSKRKPELIRDGEGLVKAVGESIEVRGVGLCWYGRVGARAGKGSSVVNLCNEALWEERVGFGEGCISYVGEGGDYVLCKGVRYGV